MALVALGPLFIMAVQGYHCAREAILESQKMLLRSVLESRKARLEDRLSETGSNMHVLAAMPCVRGVCCPPPETQPVGVSKECCGLLEHVRQTNPLFETLATYDLTGKRLGNHLADDRSAPAVLPPDLLAQLAASDAPVIAPVQRTESGGVAILIAHPIAGTSGPVTAWLVASVNVSTTLDPVFRDREGLHKSGRVYLVSPQGDYLYPPAGSSPRSSRRSRLPAEMLPGVSPDVFEYLDDRNTAMLGAASVVPALKWTLVAEMRKREAYAWLWTLRNRALATGMITLALVLVVAARSSRRLARPLRELAAVSRKIAQGRHEERLGPLDGAEAEDVARAFNKMLDELGASHRRLTHAASLAAVGELSSSIAHEMRNPLSSVKINLQALRRRVQGDPAHSELGDIALEQLARVERMLSDLLGYGKPLRLSLKPTAFAKIAKDVLEVVRKEADEKKVSVGIDDRLDSTPIVADAEQIRRALTNLVTNAIQAVAVGGKVHVSADRAAEDREKVAIRVSDNGPGIPPLRKADLFTPFFSTRPDGTGLGLANVKKIVDCHAGTCFAENAATGGAVFTIVLPLGGPPA